MDDRLLEPGLIENVNIALTSRCNLRCVYCPTGHERTRDADLPQEALALLKQFILEERVAVVGLGHVGETTLFPGWESFCGDILDAGCAMTMLSNFARPFKDSELSVLARFAVLNVSVDTADAAALKTIRRGLDIRTVLHNISRIKAFCLKNGLKPPRLGWVATLSDRVAEGIVDLYCLAVASGADSINFHQLLRFQDAPNTLRDIMELPRREFLNALDAIHRCQEMAPGHGVELSVGGIGIMEAMERCPDSGPRPAASQPSMLGELSCHVNPTLPGQTRMCFMPWVSPYVNPLRPEGDVYPCCATGRPLGRLKEAGGMRAMLSSSPYRQLRAALLQGRLPLACRHCPIKAPCSPSELQSALRRGFGIEEPSGAMQ